MPSQAIFDLAVAKQTAKGSPASAAAYRFPIVSGTVGPARVVNDLEETTRDRLRAQSYLSQVSVEGNPEYAIRLPSLGLLLYLAMGTKAVSGAGDPFTHTFTLANTLPWSTWWRNLGDLIFEKFEDCKVSELVLTSEAGQPVRAQITFMGLSHRFLAQATFNTQVAVTEDNGEPLMHYDGAGAFLVETVAAASISGIVLTVNNNVSLQQGDSVGGYGLVEGIQDITLEATQLIEDAALWNRFHYGSATPSDLATPSTNVLELAASGVDFKWTQVAASPGPERSLQVTATRLQVQELAGYEPGTGQDPLERVVTYKVYDPGATSGLTAVLKNGVTAY